MATGKASGGARRERPTGTFPAGEAARRLGISLDGRRRVPVAELDRLGGRPTGTLTGTNLSARNRLPGVVRGVQADGVMALVEIEAGPFTLAAAITRDAVEELGLAPGVPVVATIKATSVMVSREGEMGR